MFSSKSDPKPDNFIIYEPNSNTTFSKSGIYSPFRKFIASITSNEFPTACPNGSSMFVNTHTVSLLASFPIFIISLDNFSAFCISCINAPFPTGYI